MKSFWEYSGGFGHMLMMGQAGFLSTPERSNRCALQSRGRARLKELATNADPAELWGKSKAAPVKDGVVAVSALSSCVDAGLPAPDLRIHLDCTQ